MKKTSILLTATLGFGLLFTSCGNSLKNKTLTLDYKEDKVSFKFEDESNVTVSFDNLSGKGTYSYNPDAKTVIVNSDSNNSDEIHSIVFAVKDNKLEFLEKIDEEETSVEGWEGRRKYGLYSNDLNEIINYASALGYSYYIDDGKELVAELTSSTEVRKIQSEVTIWIDLFDNKLSITQDLGRVDNDDSFRIDMCKTDELKSEIEDTKDRHIHDSYLFDYDAETYLIETLGTETTYYAPYNLVSSYEGPWVPKGNPVGQKFTVSGKWEPHLKGFFVYNGYQDRYKPDLYEKNSRLKTLKVTCLETGDSDILGIPDNKGRITCDISQILPKENSDNITLECEILNVYSGYKYNDLCITAITPYF